jgi:hypothetical protein
MSPTLSEFQWSGWSFFKVLLTQLGERKAGMAGGVYYSIFHEIVIGFIIIAIRKSAQRSPSKDFRPPVTPSPPVPSLKNLADKVQSLKNTNSVIRALSFLGGLILIVVGMVGDCVEDCSGGYFSTPVMEPSIELVALGVTSLLFSTLIASSPYLQLMSKLHIRPRQ